VVMRMVMDSTGADAAAFTDEDNDELADVFVFNGCRCSPPKLMRMFSIFGNSWVVFFVPHHPIINCHHHHPRGYWTPIEQIEHRMVLKQKKPSGS
jgi:hypothetical protein